MYKKPYEIAVGIFVILGIIALIFMELKVSGLSMASIKNDHYLVTAEFSDIGSLRNGAAVRIAGIEIGVVKKIDLTTNYNGFIAIITLAIRQKYAKIPSDYAASIQTSGILGDSFIGLQPAKITLPNADGSDYLKNGSTISLANTSSAINLNSLISIFASGSRGK